MIPIEFTSSDQILQGYFFPSAGATAIATIIFLQGFPGIEGDELICQPLAQAGINVLTFNYSGTFRSAGSFSFSQAITDIGAAMQFIQKAPALKTHAINPQQIVLGGWSFGGALTPAGAARHPEFARLFVISGRNFGLEARQIAQNPAYAQTVAQNLEAIRTPHGPVHFIDDLLADLAANHDALDQEKLAPLLTNRNILLIGGWDDDIVPIENHILPFYRSLMQHGTINIKIVAFQDDHEFANSKEQLVQLIVDWLRAD